MEDELNLLFPNIDLSLLSETDNEISIDGKMWGRCNLETVARILDSWYPNAARSAWFTKQLLLFNYNEDGDSTVGPKLMLSTSGRFYLDNFSTMTELKVHLTALIKICLLAEKKEEYGF